MHLFQYMQFLQESNIGGIFNIQYNAKFQIYLHSLQREDCMQQISANRCPFGSVLGKSWRRNHTPMLTCRRPQYLAFVLRARLADGQGGGTTSPYWYAVYCSQSAFAIARFLDSPDGGHTSKSTLLSERASCVCPSFKIDISIDFVLYKQHKNNIFVIRSSFILQFISVYPIFCKHIASTDR